MRREALDKMATLDRNPESEGIDLSALPLYRLARVRNEMAENGIDAMSLIVLDTMESSSGDDAAC